MEPSEQDGPSENERGPTRAAGSVKQGLNTIKEVALAAIKDSPAWAKVLVAVVALFAVVAFGIAAVLAFSEPHLAFWLGVVFAVLCLAGIVALLFIVWLHSKKPQATALAPGAIAPRSTPAWVRDVPRLPIQEAKLIELRNALRGIRDGALAWLNDRTSNCALQTAQVRANVFLPDTNATSRGHVCELFMLPQLRIDMVNHPDENIRFLPDQGLTGAVFVRQEQLLIYTKRGAQKGTEEGVQVYPLTDAQIRQIHPKLAWIVSFPLKIPDTVGGVLNLDGLDQEVDRTILEGLMGHLAIHVARFAELLAGVPKNRVTITLEEIGDA